ncbi:craniofacial development protein 2 [Biomphalaria glabrata]|nr:craniofacial development protein 2 [Biomphalaria glabrata]
MNASTLKALTLSNAESRLLQGPSSCSDEAERHQDSKKDDLSRTKKLHFDRMADVRFKGLLQVDLRKPQDDDPVSNWSQLKAILQGVTAKVMGYCSKPNKDWFDENNSEI